MKKKVLLILFILQLVPYAEEGCNSVSFSFTEKNNFYKSEEPSFRYARYEGVPYLDSVQIGIYITVSDAKNNVRAETFIPEKGNSMDIYMFPYVGEFDGYESFYSCIQPYVLSNKGFFLENCYVRNKPIVDLGKLKSSIEKIQGNLSCNSDCNQNYDIVVRHVTLNGFTQNSLSNVSCMKSIYENDEFFEPYRFVDSLVRDIILKKMNQCSWEKLGFSKDCPLP